MPLFEGNLLTHRYEIWSQHTRNYAIIRQKKRSLSHLGLNRYLVVTDGQNYDS